MPYVSRGGLKLAHALATFAPRRARARWRWTSARRPAGSPTACCRRGRRACTAVDVGHGQLRLEAGVRSAGGGASTDQHPPPAARATLPELVRPGGDRRVVHLAAAGAAGAAAAAAAGRAAGRAGQAAVRGGRGQGGQGRHRARRGRRGPTALAGGGGGGARAGLRGAWARPRRPSPAARGTSSSCFTCARPDGILRAHEGSGHRRRRLHRLAPGRAAAGAGRPRGRASTTSIRSIRARSRSGTWPAARPTPAFTLVEGDVRAPGDLERALAAGGPVGRGGAPGGAGRGAPLAARARALLRRQRHGHLARCSRPAGARGVAPGGVRLVLVGVRRRTAPSLPGERPLRAAAVALRGHASAPASCWPGTPTTCTAWPSPACASSPCTARASARIWPSTSSPRLIAGGEPIELYGDGSSSPRLHLHRRHHRRRGRGHRPAGGRAPAAVPHLQPGRLAHHLAGASWSS